MIPIRYRPYRWRPPNLTPLQKLEIGREIITTGRGAFFEQNHPYLSKEEQEQLARSKHMSRKQKVRVIALALLLFGPVVFFVGWPFLILLLVASPVLVLSLGTMFFARRRYRRWVDEMADGYTRHVANLPTTSER